MRAFESECIWNVERRMHPAEWIVFIMRTQLKIHSFQLDVIDLFWCVAAAINNHLFSDEPPQVHNLWSI